MQMEKVMVTGVAGQLGYDVVKILNERKLAGITTIGYLPQITISFEMMINMAVFMMVFLTKMSI